MDIEKEIQRFKMELLRKMPFYGDVIAHIEFVKNKNIPTAATNGKVIWYNPDFFSGINSGYRNFIIMHEFFHIMLRHGMRNADGEKDAAIWNAACDIIINDMLIKMRYSFISNGISYQRPDKGIFADIKKNETAENLYAKIKSDNETGNKNTGKLIIRKQYIADKMDIKDICIYDNPSDIKIYDMRSDEIKLNDLAISELISRSASKNRASMGSYRIPSEMLALTRSKRLNWKKLLKDFLTQEIGDETSYTTPERKYIHMDMILPGHSLCEENVEEIWAFVDSSGSIEHPELEQFLTQLHRISREFKCVFNICFWDVEVNAVYKKILREDDIFKCIPKTSGGTDINCVYRWLHKNKVKPDVMLILTDGYFGRITAPEFNSKLSKKTILVLSSDISINDDIKRIGKIAKL